MYIRFKDQRTSHNREFFLNSKSSDSVITASYSKLGITCMFDIHAEEAFVVF